MQDCRYNTSQAHFSSTPLYSSLQKRYFPSCEMEIIVRNDKIKILRVRFVHTQDALHIHVSFAKKYLILTYFYMNSSLLWYSPERTCHNTVSNSDFFHLLLLCSHTFFCYSCNN